MENVFMVHIVRQKKQRLNNKNSVYNSIYQPGFGFRIQAFFEGRYDLWEKQ